MMTVIGRLTTSWFILFLVFSSLSQSGCETMVDELVRVEYLSTDPVFPADTTQSFYMMMRDGVRIAVDAHFPQPLWDGAQLPTIVVMTRYWRSEVAGETSHMGWRFAEATRRGFVVFNIDERGTGASFGTWRHPWSAESRADYAEIVDWITEQDWSNGTVGAWGISYLGMTAQMLPTVQRSALRVAIPTFTQYDVYTDIAYPGGIFNDLYVGDWAADTRDLDLNLLPGRSVRPVDQDVDGSLLAQAVAEHAANGNVYEGFKNVIYRDVVAPNLGVSLDDISAHVAREEIEHSGVVLYHWGSWMDHGTAMAVIDRFLTLDNPQHAVIGAWTHGGFEHASPYVSTGPPQPGEVEQWKETLNFLDRFLKNDPATDTEKILYYYTMGAEEWRSTDVWPVAGTTTENCYFAADNTLSTIAPAETVGADTYAVDFTATTGDQTRWHTDLVIYPNRVDEDQKLLTYTSEPLSEDTEITGHPVVTLYVTSTHSDGAFFVYLEDVSPDGHVTYVTEGQLRALHRKVSQAPPEYEQLIPYHSFKQEDGEPMIPGEIAELTFGLLPTSALFRAGHRIRVAIAGDDSGLFERIPETGDPVITMERNAIHASKIGLPVVRR